jgi:hypothetical protein
MPDDDPVVESLRAVAKIAERPPLGFSLEDVLAEGTARRLRPGPWHHRVAVIAVAAAILVVFFVPLPHLGLLHHLVTSKKTSPAGSSKGRSTTVSHSPWPESLLAQVNLAPQSAVVVPGPQSSEPIILGFEINGCMEPCSEPIVRLDSRTWSIKVGPVMTAGSFLETVGDRVIVFTPREMSLQGEVSGGWSLRTVDVSTLQLGPSMRLPLLGNAAGLYATVGVHGTADVWIEDYQVDRGTLLLLNTAAGKLVRTVGIAGADSLELSPDGRTLYELGTGSTNGNRHESVTELDALTGRILAARREAFSSGGTAGLTTVGGGVWVTSYESSVSLLSSNDLRPIALPPGALPPDPPTQAADIWRGFSAYNLGPFVLLQSYRGMTCVRPNTGSVRATALWTVKQAPGWTPIALDSNNLVAVQITGFSSSKVFAVHIPASCLG